MTDTLVDLKQCPKCCGEKLVPVNAGEATNFFCEDCTFCWHVDGGSVALVDPHTCPGCELTTLGWWCP